MNKKFNLLTLCLMAALTLSLAGCGKKAQIVGKWHLDRVCVAGDCKDVPADATTFMDIRKDGTFTVTNAIGRSGNAYWSLKDEYLYTDDGTTKEKFHIDVLTDSQLRVTETMEFGEQTLELSRKK